MSEFLLGASMAMLLMMSAVSMAAAGLACWALWRTHQIDTKTGASFAHFGEHFRRLSDDVNQLEDCVYSDPVEAPGSRVVH